MINNKSIILPVKFSKEFPSVLCLMSTGSCGNAKSESNLKSIALTSNIDYNKITTCNQVHGNKIETVKKENTGNKFTGADGLVTDIEDIPLAVFTADCLSVFLYDPVTRAAGIAHAGWKGTVKKVVKKAVASLKERYKSNPDNIYAALGPCICCKCHEYDLVKENLKQLKESGVSAKSINITGICTYEDRRFFSYRRAKGTEERMVSVLMLKAG